MKKTKESGEKQESPNKNNNKESKPILVLTRTTQHEHTANHYDTVVSMCGRALRVHVELN